MVRTENSKHKRKHYDQYSSFDSKRYMSAKQKRRLLFRITLAVVSAFALVIVGFVLWAYSR